MWWWVCLCSEYLCRVLVIVFRLGMLQRFIIGIFLLEECSVMWYKLSRCMFSGLRMLKWLMWNSFMLFCVLENRLCFMCMCWVVMVKVRFRLCSQYISSVRLSVYIISMYWLKVQIIFGWLVNSVCFMFVLCVFLQVLMFVLQQWYLCVVVWISLVQVGQCFILLVIGRFYWLVVGVVMVVLMVVSVSQCVGRVCYVWKVYGVFCL